MAGDVGVILANGTPGTVPENEVAEVVARGGRQITDAQLDALRQQVATRARYDLTRHPLNAAGATVASGALGAASGATLGLSDLAVARLGGDSARKQVQEWREAAPIAGGIGELAGFLGAMALTEGAAAGGAGAAGAARAGSLAGRLATGAARSAAEFGAMEGGHELSRQALAGEDVDAGRIASQAGRGALTGAALGVPFGLVGEGARAIMGRTRGVTEAAIENHALAGEAVVASGGRAAEGGEKAYDALAARAVEGETNGAGKALAAEAQAAGEKAPSGVFDRVARGYIDARPGTSPERARELGEAWERRAQVLQNHAETIDNATRDFSKALDAQLSAARKADMASFGEAKTNQMARLVDRTQAAAQGELLAAWGARAKASVDELIERGTAGMTPTTRKNFEAWHRQLTRAIESGDSLEMFATADKLKRWVGRQAQFGAGPFGLSDAAREFDALYQGESGLQQILENAAWGDAGTAQREINASTHRMISEGKVFSRKFTTEFGSELGRPTYRADTSAVSGFMNRLTSAANDLDAHAVDSYLQARKGFLDAAEKSYTFDATTQKAIASERQALEQMKQTFDRTTKDVSISNRVRAALEEERARGIGGVVGAVLGGQTQPYTMLRRLASLEETVQSVTRRGDAGVEKLVSGKTPSEGLSAPSPTRGKGFFSKLLDGAGRTAQASVKSAPVVVGGVENMRRSYATRAGQIATLTSNPDALAERVSQAVTGPTDASPKATAAATATAMRGLAYLQQKLPPTRSDPFTTQPQFQHSRASDTEIARFMRTAAAIDHPLSVLEEAKRGTLTRDHVEAVKAVYPELYKQIQTQVYERLASGKSELPYAKRVQLAILLDIPTDKSLSPAFMKAIAATYGAPAKQAESPPPHNAPQLHVSEPEMTGLEAAASRL